MKNTNAGVKKTHVSLFCSKSATGGGKKNWDTWRGRNTLNETKMR